MNKNIWICIGKAGNNYDAYAPDVPGCIATGIDIETTKANMIRALSRHLQGMLEDGESFDSVGTAFPIADAIEAKEKGEEEYYSLVEVNVVKELIPTVTQ
ncbi:MAG: type II toxin-antitoxin system HicB family antitoxin [Planctomycetes bacterium]|nr:type II toxin-antitoxin system HicB family antitoxin [Planctomycetota bacterium]